MFRKVKTGNWFALVSSGFCQKYGCGDLPFVRMGHPRVRVGLLVEPGDRKLSVWPHLNMQAINRYHRGL